MNSKCGCLTLKGKPCQKPKSKGKDTCSMHKKVSRKKSSIKILKKTSIKKSLNIESRPSLDQVLSIYTYPFLGHAYEFVKKNEHTRKDIVKYLTVIYPKDLLLNDVMKHAYYRHPIHIHGPQYKHIHESKMKSILAYSKQNVKKNDNVLLRYGILAPSVMNENLCGFKNAWFLHVWGVNLESKHTLDGLTVFQKGKFQIHEYKKLLDRLFQIIKGACEHLHTVTKKIVVLRITKLGFGVWSAAIPKEYKSTLMDYFFQKLEIMVSSRLSWLQIRLPDYPNHRTYVIGPWTGWTIGEKNHDPFGVPKGMEDSSYIKYPSNSISLIVNAWDDASFIGNAGSNDNTLDGWTVASGSNTFSKSEFGKPMGYHFVNTTFLHNLFFYPIDDIHFHTC